MGQIKFKTHVLNASHRTTTLTSRAPQAAKETCHFSIKHRRFSVGILNSFCDFNKKKLQKTVGIYIAIRSTARIPDIRSSWRSGGSSSPTDTHTRRGVTSGSDRCLHSISDSTPPREVALPRIAKYTAVFQGVFSILSAFSIENSQSPAYILQFAVPNSLSAVGRAFAEVFRSG